MISLTNGPATVARLGAQSARRVPDDRPDHHRLPAAQAKVMQTMAHSGIKGYEEELAMIADARRRVCGPPPKSSAARTWEGGLV